MAVQFPPCPPSLRPIQHYLKTAAEHERRDPVVTYWCRLYALQTALKIDKKSDDAKLLLVSLMDWLEKQKSVLADNEAITNDIAAQAHIENYALRLFVWADSQDRSGVFNKNVVKAFYTAGMLMDILTIVGEVGEEISANCKYAKWKAAYIHNCLKNGETPIPGPMNANENGEFESDNAGETSGNNVFTQNLPSSDINLAIPNIPDIPVSNISNQPSPTNEDSQSESGFAASTTHHSTTFPTTDSDIKLDPDSATHQSMTFPTTDSGIKLDPLQITKAQKYCKFAGSALNYDDVPEAINYLQKALKLLQTGQDS